ncbi:MAG: methyltransferase domain-containing protein [Anaerolineales bacterium]|nr:methyltransferase domain-containing protein [Anaerolineales bacterium]
MDRFQFPNDFQYLDLIDPPKADVNSKDKLSRLHNRYKLQAKWTVEVRRKLLAQIQLPDAANVLEVGSGTGAITSELAEIFKWKIFGVDIDLSVTAFAHGMDQKTRYVVADGLRLPFKTNFFDLTLSHFLLLWVKNPDGILSEMRRVAKPGCQILALAEPDYGGRIDYPDALIEIGQLQADALIHQGADPRMGRKLRALFHQAELEDVQAGVLGGEWRVSNLEESFESEWITLMEDLAGVISEGKLKDLRELDRDAQKYGSRILYVPTFYALGRVPIKTQ